MFNKILILVCLTTTLFNPKPRAAVILSDAFTYPDGVLQTVSSNKWVGHSGATNQVDVTRGALNLTGAESQDVNALLSGQAYDPTNNVVLYAAFDLKVTTLPSKTGSYFAHFKDALDGFRGRIWALTNGAAPGSFRLGVSSGSGSAVAAVHQTDLQAGVSYKVVCSLGVSNAMTTLWINPKSETDTRVSAEAASGISIAAFAFRQATGIGVMTIDNLVIGTAFHDVVPPAEAPVPPATSQVVSPPKVSAPPAASEVVPPPKVSPPPTASVVVPPPEPAPPPASSGAGAPPQAAPPPPPSLLITVQPENQTVGAGQDVSFKAQAQGVEPIFYQWQFNQIDILDATNQVLTISNASPAQQGDYRLVVRNSSGLATSAAARLTVIGPAPPQIFGQPISLTVDQGQTANFFVAATGSAPLHYQWRFNGSEIVGATSSTLTLDNAQRTQSGKYHVTVSNSAGSVESEVATLKVNSTVIETWPNPPKPPSVHFTNYLAGLLRAGDLLTNSFTEHALAPGETLTMRVTVAAPDERPVTLWADSSGLPASARWAIRETVGTNLSAVFTWVPTTNEAGSNFVISLYESNSVGTNASRWSLYVPTEQEQQIVISEFLPNPATTNTATHFNPLHRAEPAPNPEWNDEYVELVNFSERDIDLSQWTLSDSVQARHRFDELFTLQAWGAIVVYGGPRAGFSPQLTSPTIWANESSTGLGLNNSGGDTLILRNAQGRMVSRIVYSFVSTNSSLTRYPTLNDDFVAHAGVSTNYTSPGVNYDGREFGELAHAPAVPIVLAAVLERGPRVVLRWNAEPSRPYSVVHSANLVGPYSPVATGLRFQDRTGRYELESRDSDAARFYRIRTP